MVSLWKVPFLLLLSAKITAADLDIVFFVDTSGSMQPHLSLLASSIDQIVASTQGLSGTAQYGLVTFEDYPSVPWGSEAAGDEPYRRLVNLTPTTQIFTNSVKGLTARNGNDNPGSQLVAVRQALVGTAQTHSDYVVSTLRITFRPTAQKLLVMWSDSGFHPKPIDGTSYPGPTFASVLTNLQNASVTPPYRFVGLNPGGAATDGLTPRATTDLQILANATGALATSAVDCGAGNGPDISAGGILVCTQVSGSVAAVQQGFINTITNAATLDTPADNPAPTPTVPPILIQTCFSNRNMVTEKNKGDIYIDQVRVGDEVETANGGFSKVISWAHFHTDMETEFLQITTEKGASTLEITGDHLLFLNGQAQRASHVRIGDRLGDKVVSHISTVKRKGVYAPLTESGELLVSGVRVSSFVGLLEDAGVVWNQHYLGQLLSTPIRALCRSFPDYCAAETHDELGYSNLYSGLLPILFYLGQCGSAMSITVTAAAAPFLVALWILEQATRSTALILAVVTGSVMVHSSMRSKRC